MRVLAPAGSGKTKTLVNRICNLVNGGVEPECILPLAFNRKAAAEMNERLTAKGLGRVRARTFHSLGYEIVRAGSRFRFDEEREEVTTRELLKEALLSLHPAIPPAEGEALGRIVRLCSAVKRDLLPLEGDAVGRERRVVSIRSCVLPLPGHAGGTCLHDVRRHDLPCCAACFSTMIPPESIPGGIHVHPCRRISGLEPGPDFSPPDALVP